MLAGQNILTRRVFSSVYDRDIYFGRSNTIIINTGKSKGKVILARPENSRRNYSTFFFLTSRARRKTRSFSFRYKWQSSVGASIAKAQSRKTHLASKIVCFKSLENEKIGGFAAQTERDAYSARAATITRSLERRDARANAARESL